MTVFEIPTKPQPQSFAAVFPSGVTYNLRLIYQFNADNCWLLDIADANNNPLVSGVPLVTGADLLAQYAYLGLGVSLYAATDGDPTRPPSWWDFGSGSHLYAVAN